MTNDRLLLCFVLHFLVSYQLPLQLLYQGKTAACLPRFAFPSEWNVIYTRSHWSNEQKTKKYIHKFILPYDEAKCKAHGRPSQTPLVIFDAFKCQVTDNVYNLLDNHNIQVVKVPPNCMDRFQLMDLSINKSVKDYLRDKFQKWYSSEIDKSYHQDESTTPVMI